MKNKKMTKSAIVTYKVYWSNDPNPLVVSGKSFTAAMRLAGYDLDKVKDGIDYFTSSDSVDDEDNNNEF